MNFVALGVAGDDQGSVGYSSADVFRRFILVFCDNSHFLCYLSKFCSFHLGQVGYILLHEWKGVGLKSVLFLVAMLVGFLYYRSIKLLYRISVMNIPNMGRR